MKKLIFRLKYAFGFIAPEPETLEEDVIRMALYIKKSYSPENRAILVNSVKEKTIRFIELERDEYTKYLDDCRSSLRSLKN
jgi:hypothetical protein